MPSPYPHSQYPPLFFLFPCRETVAGWGCESLLLMLLLMLMLMLLLMLMLHWDSSPSPLPIQSRR